MIELLEADGVLIMEPEIMFVAFEASRYTITVPWTLEMLIVLRVVGVVLAEVWAVLKLSSVSTSLNKNEATLLEELDTGSAGSAGSAVIASV